MIATIIDNDTQVTDVNGNGTIDASEKANLSVRDVVVDEKAGTATFDLVLSKATSTNFSVAYSTTDGTAAAGTDFTAASGSVTFAAGQTSQRVTVNIVDDSTLEGNEYFHLNLGAITGSSEVLIADGVGTAFIGANDQTPTAAPIISASDLIVSESDGYAEFTVRLSAPASSPITVQYAMASGSASYSSGDYESKPGILTFAVGTTTQTVRIPLNDDTIVEDTESFYLELYGAKDASGNVVKIANNKLIATIIDNDSSTYQPMIYGLGNDVYVINATNQYVAETLNGGIDTVQSSITYSLVDTDGDNAFGANVENLTLTGSADINGTGNALNNFLVGNSGANTLTGDAGNDTLTGGAGADRFQVNAALLYDPQSNTSYTDTITDFQVGVGGDVLAGFTSGLSNYTSGANPFTSGHARLTQSGTDTLLEIDTDGTNGSAPFRTAAILQNVAKSSLVAANLDGFAPSGATTGGGTGTGGQPTPAGPQDDFVVLQASSPGTVGAGVGNDVYLLSGSMIPAGKAITLSDAQGTNSIQLASGLQISSAQVAANALKLNLANGSSITVLGASQFTYEAGGNSTAGIDQPDLGYAQFVQSILGVSVPTSGAVTSGLVTIGSSVSPASATPAGPQDDFVVLQASSPGTVGAGVGNDVYLLSGSMIPAGKAITLSDAQGTNSIQLASGLQISSAQVAANALKLNLANGSSITVLGASQFTYEAGGNSTAGIDQPDLGYAQFVQSILGVSVPTSGAVTSGPVTIGSTASSATPVSGNQTVVATAQADVFSFDVAAALADTAGTNTQAGISGFSASSDKLQIDLPVANASLTTLAQLNGVQGVAVQDDPFAGDTLIDFGNDANGGQSVALRLIGITDPATVQIQVV